MGGSQENFPAGNTKPQQSETERTTDTKEQNVHPTEIRYQQEELQSAQTCMPRPKH